MMLILTDATLRHTTSNNLPYIALQFYYPAKSKTVEYKVWSFIHNEANGLQRVWDVANRPMLGKTYELYFEKRSVNGMTQFVVTRLEQILT